MVLIKTKCAGIVIVLAVCFFSFNAVAADLTWQTTKQAAVKLAKQQGKKIILLAGRDT